MSASVLWLRVPSLIPWKTLPGWKLREQHNIDKKNPCYCNTAFFQLNAPGDCLKLHQFLIWLQFCLLHNLNCKIIWLSRWQVPATQATAGSTTLKSLISLRRNLRILNRPLRIGKNCWHSGAAKHIKIICLPRYSSLNKGGAVVRALASHRCGPRPNRGLDVIHVCGLSLLMVLPCSERFFSRYPGFLLFCIVRIIILPFSSDATTYFQIETASLADSS